MKRFITYLYQYEQGMKSINTGFARIDLRGDVVKIEISVRNLGHFQEPGKIYGLIYQEEMIGVHLGDMRIYNGQGNKTIELNVENIADSGFNMGDLLGLSIDFQDIGFLAACWKEEYAKQIGKAQIHIRPWNPPQLAEELPEIICEALPQEVVLEEIVAVEGSTTYKKIDLSNIHKLPTKNWYLSNNSFLVHGFWNYGYLVLQKKITEGQETFFLGVPGIFEKPEMLMAVLFGFPEFEALPEGIKSIGIGEELSLPEKKTKNQEPEVGTFGAWFVKLEE